jgi:outer membrane receptor for ferrienterochelin and colicins
MRDGLFMLRPERIHSTEAVWEEYISSRVRTTVTAFLYDAKELIEQRSLDMGGGSDLYFVNSGDVEGRGVESEIETKLPGGLSGRLSHTYVVAEDTVTDTPFSNSPRHLAKLNLQVPVSRFYLGFEGQFVGERTTLGGESLAPFFVPNLTLTSPVRRHVELTLSVFNLLDHHYADPGAEEHVQQAIRQDGRTFLARANLRF